MTSLLSCTRIVGLTVGALALLGCFGTSNNDTSPVGTGEGEFGDFCEAIGECTEGLVCAGDGVCRYEGDPGTWRIGTECASTDYCAMGLVCGSSGECTADGSPGTTLAGGSCDLDDDCAFGLTCADDTCAGFQMPLWTGAECRNSDLDPYPGAFRMFFEVPEADQPLDEFYKLPFPNDARVRSTGLDMSGHPVPGALIPELGDVVGNTLSAWKDDFDGFGNNAGVFMRFSQPLDYGTIVLGTPEEDGTLFIVDITPGLEEPPSGTYGVRHPGGWRGFDGRRTYICDNWITVYPSDGRPFEPGHTYAAMVTTGIKAGRSDTSLTRDDHFNVMVADQAPSSSSLREAWDSYAPLRDYLAKQSYPPSIIAGATVFTVGSPDTYPPRLRDAVWTDADAPTVDATDLTLCQDGDAGPFADSADSTRGCQGTHAGFKEIQGRLKLPAYQQGTPPYKFPADGGYINWPAEGQPMAPARYDEVHFTLTVPTGVAMPAEGWPLVLYGHGTGGNYRSNVSTGVAETLSSVTVSSGTANFATLSIDQVMHGPRRASQNWDSDLLAIDPNAYAEDVLYFNATNPRAGRDNGLQSAADWFAVTRWALEADWDSSASPTGERITFNNDQFHYMGHSQGVVAGMNFVPYEPSLQSLVLSGGGGMLIHSLLEKTSPHDIAQAVRIGLVDGQVDRLNPMLNIVQAMSERSDGVNHAVHVHSRTLDGIDRRHVLQTMGVGDTYSPDETQYALARAMKVEQVMGDTTVRIADASNTDAYRVDVPLAFITEADTPVTGNRSGVTAVVRLYDREGSNDAHFVLFDRDDAQVEYSTFLATALLDGVPTVVDGAAK